MVITPNKHLRCLLNHNPPYSEIPGQTLPLTPPFPQNHPSAFGKRFFEHKTADKDSHKQMVDEWFSGLEPDVKQRMENKIQTRKMIRGWTIPTLGKIVRKKDRKPWWFNTSTGEWDTRFNEDQDKEEEDFMINICERIPTSRSSIKISCHCKWDLTKWSGRMKEPFLQITGSDDEDAQMS